MACDELVIRGFSTTLEGRIKKISATEWGWQVVLADNPAKVTQYGTSKSRKKAIDSILKSSGSVQILCAMKPKKPTAVG